MVSAGFDRMPGAEGDGYRRDKQQAGTRLQGVLKLHPPRHQPNQ